MSGDSKPVLAYWGIRGLAQPIRLLLKYVGDDFENKIYTIGPAPEFNRDGWMKDKFSIGLDLPNLPYYIDGDIKITQSNAILRHIARKHSLCGESEAERVKVDIMENASMDFRNGAVGLFYNATEYDALLPKYLEGLKDKLSGFEKFLGEKDYFATNKITFVDFVMYELLDQHRILQPTCLDSFPKLQAFLSRMEELPKIKEYMASPEFMKSPINGPMAAFGNK